MPIPLPKCPECGQQMHVRSSSISTVAGIIMYLDVDYEHDKGDHTFTKQVRYEIDGKEIRTN